MPRHAQALAAVPMKAVMAALLLSYVAPAPAAEALALNSLADLSIEELGQIRITSVSRRPEPLATAPSAIQVITNDDIRRSGATMLPEALRLAPNLQVARLSSNDWAITARGFSGAPTGVGSLANKSLVMIDGRAIYTPVFGGVFWDEHNVVLDDIDRIEAVSGPGATMWGTNAVNGVIHVIRKHAADTQGWYGAATAGALHEDAVLRYGGRAGGNGHFRVYGQYMARDAFFSDGADDYRFDQGGFRVDLDPTASDALTVQGDFHGGRQGAANLGFNGQNLMGVWKRRYSEDSDLRLAGYVSRRWRDLGTAGTRTHTFDIDLQHRLPLGSAASLIWGTNYRLARDELEDLGTLEFEPAKRSLEDINGFVQGEFALIPDRLALTVGTKIGTNEYSGFEIQPGARVAWTPRRNQLVWSAVSRAVRAPSRFEADTRTPGLEGNPGLMSEKVTAYELGYRVQPTLRTTFSVATYYNDYDDVRSLELSSASPPILTFGNNQEAKSWGLELFGMISVTEWWRLRGFYTYLDSRFTATDPAVVPGADAVEAMDPRHQVTLHSMMDLPYRLQLDLFTRRVTSLPASPVLGLAKTPSYTSVDVRLGWSDSHWEVSLVGQNLNGGQVEMGSQEIPRSVFLRARFWY